MRKILVKLCDFLEKKLYDEPTWQELSSSLDKTRYKLFEAKEEIKRLRALLNKCQKFKQL